MRVREFPVPDDLVELFQQTTRVQVCQMEPAQDNPRTLRPRVVTEFQDPQQLEELAHWLGIHPVDSSNAAHCMCLGSVYLQFEPAGEKISLHHGKSIRWLRWRWDAPLLDGWGLARFLDRLGYAGLLEEMRQHQDGARQQVRSSQRWIEACPDCLRVFALDEFPTRPLEVLQARLAQAFPHPLRQALRLFSWYGRGDGPWSGYPSYERIAEELLAALPTPVLVQATAAANEPEQLRGAARFWAGWNQRTRLPALPSELKQRLLRVALGDALADNRQRGHAAFSD